MIFSGVQERTTTVGDRLELFEGLIRDSYKPAYGLAYRLTGNAAEAEDLVQESFVRAYRFFHRYDESLPFTSWLYRIMTNAHIDSIRRRGRLRTTSLEAAGNDGSTTWDLPDLDASPDRQMLVNALDEPVQKALLSMTPEFRTAVLLADVEGLAYEEVAEIMKTSVGTVRSRIHRGRKQIRRHLLKHAPQTYRSFCDEL
ncbi:MAG: sigma-70 family RNA polymerase sigma factor [Fimbriimonas sp.]|nr:sigma-70 family RNA polymerase sigma factor [Fimbriimonas sp.]